MLSINGLGYLAMSNLYWPDFKFPPINLFSIGPAWYEDNRADGVTLPLISLSQRSTRIDLPSVSNNLANLYYNRIHN